MKNVCFFSGDITRSGGTERVSTMIANGLAACGKYHILFLSLTEQGERPFFPLAEGIEHFALGERWINPGPGYLKVIPKLRRFLREKGIDIVIDIDIVLDVLSIPASRGLKVRIISWEHFDFAYEMGSLYRRLILKYSVKRTDYVVTLTKENQKRYGEEAGRKRNIATIYNPIQELPPDRPVEKEKWLITVGHLTRVKGTDYLGQVASIVLKRNPDWKWMGLGDGEEMGYLRAVTEKESLEGRLILTGRQKEVNSYLEKSQIYVMTSRSEGLPMCLLEAKAFRLPSVSFDIPGANEIIRDGINGYLVRAFDCQAMAHKLEWLMKEETQRQQLAQNAWSDLARFRLENILEQWIQVLDSQN